MVFYDNIQTFIADAKKEEIPSSRKGELKVLAELILRNKASQDIVNLNFICTHNSRRSQIAELTLRLFSCMHNLNFISTYSGGTEATALNQRVGYALEAHGFKVKLAEEGNNPIYSISFSNDRDEEPAMFSKTFEDESVPDKIIAIMVCSDAEENCPFIPNAESRFSLKYVDPKFSDGTDDEAKVYKEKVLEIGSEMAYLSQLLTEIKEDSE